MRTTIRIEAAKAKGEDRAEVFTLGEFTIVALADGAGGVSGGARAAQMFLELARSMIAGADLRSGKSLANCLSNINRRIENDPEAGETTGILIAIRSGEIFGASAGDSEAWMFGPQERVNLTAKQAKSRRLGTAEAAPIPFDRDSLIGTLVVASDGLWKYATIDGIAKIAVNDNLDSAAGQLVDSARLKSGQLQDDIAIVLCRYDPHSRPYGKVLMPPRSACRYDG